MCTMKTEEKWKCIYFQTKLDLYEKIEERNRSTTTAAIHKETERRVHEKANEWCKVDFTNHDRISLSFSTIPFWFVSLWVYLIHSSVYHFVCGFFNIRRILVTTIFTQPHWRWDEVVPSVIVAERLNMHRNLMDNEWCLCFAQLQTLLFWLFLALFKLRSRCVCIWCVKTDVADFCQDNALCWACNPNGRQWMKSSAKKKANNKEIKTNITKWRKCEMAKWMT